MSIRPDNDTHVPQDYTMDEEFSPVQESGDHLRLSEISEVKLMITAELGRCPMVVREVLELKRGSVLQLDKLAGEMTDIFVNNVPFGRGEVVVLGDTLHVRIAEVRGLNDKGESSNE